MLRNFYFDAFNHFVPPIGALPLPPQRSHVTGEQQCGISLIVPVPSHLAQSPGGTAPTSIGRPIAIRALSQPHNISARPAVHTSGAWSCPQSRQMPRIGSVAISRDVGALPVPPHFLHKPVAGSSGCPGFSPLPSHSSQSKPPPPQFGHVRLSSYICRSNGVGGSGAGRDAAIASRATPARPLSSAANPRMLSFGRSASSADNRARHCVSFVTRYSPS